VRYILLLIYFFLVSAAADAGILEDPVVRIMPGVSIGYTFGHGMNAGIELGVSFMDYKIGQVSSYAGIDLSYAVFTHARKLYKNGYYRVFTFNFINVINEQGIVKLGMAKTKLKWGVGNVNKSFSDGWGFNVDAAFKPFLYSPSLGFRFFKINNVCMGIGATNPKFLYLGYMAPFNLTENIAGKN